MDFKQIPLVIGHRGACGYAPENTILSFVKALEIGVDMIEFDVHLSKDGEVVVVHDDFLDRTTDAFGAVNQKTLDQLKGVNLSDNQKIPTLFEAIKLIGQKAKINIEIKGKGCFEAVNNIVKNHIENGECGYGSFLVSSFDHKQLFDLKASNTRIRLGILANDRLDRLATLAKNLTAFSVHLTLEQTSGELVKWLQKLGLKVYCYTANSVKEIDRLKQIGVDGIFSNYPDRIYQNSK